ncbi:energy transducer TonB [Sporomusa sp. KB1]|uniref:energy transducer TonB n=1 Tax=Sporomusa sp. KB1 TaxID=943346 RepID=UPI0011AC47E7|nr:energy transducer TonB [Sporomusa sp. KB1]TWH46103.1 protein TonB [Sporomusa sp. KB1]
MAIDVRWRRAAATSVVVHSLLFAGAGYLAIGLFPPPALSEPYIELAFQNEPQITSEQSSLAPAAPNNVQPQAVAAEPRPQPRVAPQAQTAAVDTGSVPVTATSVTGVSDDNSNEVRPVVSSSASGPAGNVSSGGVAPPGILAKVEPVYPQSARQAGIGGTVVLKVQVLENGQPGKITLFRSSGDTSLDESAITAMRQWRFVPARDKDSGRTMVCITTIPVSFRLNG